MDRHLGRSLCLLAIFCLIGPVRGRAQETAPAADTPAATAPVPLIETEEEVINEFEATPATITRKQGKFFLLLINKSRNSITPTLDAPGLVASAVSTVTQGLSFRAIEPRKRWPGLFDGAVGVYNVRAASGGKILLQITIE